MTNNKKFIPDFFESMHGGVAGAVTGLREHHAHRAVLEGRLTRAGNLIVDGAPLTGFFIECSGPTVRKIAESGLYNEQVYVHKDRRGANRSAGPSFHRARAGQ